MQPISTVCKNECAFVNRASCTDAVNSKAGGVVSQASVNLFRSIARSRPEWVAQGLLKHAIISEASVRALLLERTGLERLEWQVRETPEVQVEEEQPTDTGWRADLVVRWGGIRPLRLELKLLAGFTPAQRAALRAQEIDLVVALDGREVPDGATVVTWSELAARTKDEVLKSLLSQMTPAAMGFIQTLDQATISPEFQSFVNGGEDRRWPSLYAFLSTIHAHLHDDAQGDYTPDGWSQSRKGVPYYGYGFRMTEGSESSQCWVGFTKIPDNEAPHFALMLRRPGDNEYSTAFAKRSDLEAEALVQRIRVELPKSRERGPI